MKEHSWGGVGGGGGAAAASATAPVAAPAPVAPVTEPAVPPPDTITPDEYDSLYACMYIIESTPTHYEFMTAGRESPALRKIEMDFKFKIVQSMIESPEKIRNSNQRMTKVSAEEIKTNLLAGKRCGIAELIMFCIYMEHSVRLIMDRVLYMDITPEIFKAHHTILYNSADKKFSIWVSEREPAQPPICANQYKNPIRGFSAYKSDELNNMYMALFGLGAPRPNNKAELYEKVRVRFFEIFPR